ncbi:MAG: adenylate kinase [Anaerolineae bacterium]|nr:adenylate kinase [Anaerolineae bacterium]
MQRIVIVGVGGSGKSTLGAEIAARLNMKFVELDALHWQKNWQEAPTSLFRDRVSEALSDVRWVVSGNYSKARDLIWTQADTLIWLDYSLLLCLWRLFWRTLKRVITQEDLWGTGNRETWRAQFLSRDSLFIWMFKGHRRYRREYPRLLTQPQYAHLDVLHFTRSQQTEAWLQTLPRLSTNQGHHS